MTPERWNKIKKIFEAAQEVSSGEREEFLRNACGDDAELKAEIEMLFDSLENAESFLEKPVAAEVPTFFEKESDLVSEQNNDKNFIAGTIVENRYRIVGLLGKGGMGKVFRAEDLKLKQEVALKFLPENLEKNESALQRFISEVRTARQVSHPNVCKVFDIGESGGKHFLSMEFIDGDDLSSLLRRIGRLPPDKAAEISRQICFGLHAIHDAGILHRDLKPSNIIIDSKGKAFITDFGIAGLDGDISFEEIRAGTPAYMSPEQITGKDVTAKSDIYSLGLLLYEIFTGRQAFKADSLDELIKKHQTTAPTNPSEFVENINPLVEKTINRCLEKNPSHRPKSALQIALALPGGNPLEAAIAAGETPSPEMVAAAPKKGALNPKIALALLLAFFAIFIFLSIAQQKSKIFNFAPPEKPKEVLAEKSREILKRLGYEDLKAHSIYGFQKNEDYIDFANPKLMDRELKIVEVKKFLASGRVPIANFLYRQSPEYLEPNRTEKVTASDPPFDVPNMVNLKLDAQGRLIELIVVPPKIAAQNEKRETDWSKIFAEAGLEISKFQRIEANRTPPIFADEIIVWQGTWDELPDIPVRIEAASLNGKPVFFQTVAPWNEKAVEISSGNNSYESSLSVNTSYNLGIFTLISIHFLVLIGSIFLVRRNLKAGRGDLRGALKLTLFIFLLIFVRSFIYADHVPTVWGELTIFYNSLAYSLVVSLFTGLIYISLEPFVRRYWSELLISWSRLLKGDFLDPLIGRDLLVGMILGMGHTLGIFIGSVGFAIITGNDGVLNEFYEFIPINGITGTISAFLDVAPDSVTRGFVVLFLLLGFYMLTKNKRTSISILFLIAVAMQGLLFVLTQHWIFIFAAIFNAVCMCLAVYRFGLVGIIAFGIGFALSYISPLTFNTSSQYFPNTVLTFVFAFALAVYSFYVSKAGQSVFDRKMPEE